MPCPAPPWARSKASQWGWERSQPPPLPGHEPLLRGSMQVLFPPSILSVSPHHWGHPRSLKSKPKGKGHFARCCTEGAVALGALPGRARCLSLKESNTPGIRNNTRKKPQILKMPRGQEREEEKKAEGMRERTTKRERNERRKLSSKQQQQKKEKANERAND